MAASQIVIALVTAPDLKVARKLAAEILILLKTTKANVGKVEQCGLENHPHDTPQFIVLSVAFGSKRYFDWITESVQ